MFLTKESKSPYFQLIYFVEGKRRKVSTKKTNLNEAKIFLASFSIPHQVNNVVYELNNSIMLSKFQDECINYLSQSKAKSYIERSIKPAFKFLLVYTGDVLLTDLTVRLLDSFINERFKISQTSSKLYYSTLKAIFSKAVNWGYLQENPFKKIKTPKVSKSIPLFISVDDFTKIITKIKNPVLQNIFTLAFYTGMRLGEILNMKWNWVNLNQNLITVKCNEEFTTKSKKERVIPISKNLKPILLNQFPKLIDINQNHYVFTKCEGIKLNENFVSKQFKKSIRVAELNDKIHFHTLRHSFASNLVQKGVSLYVVKELLGHEDIKTTQIYSHLQQENLYQAVNLL